MGTWNDLLLALRQTGWPWLCGAKSIVESQTVCFSITHEDLLMTSNLSSENPTHLPSQASSPDGRRVWFVLLSLVWGTLLVGSMLVGNLAGGHGSPAAVSMRMGSSVVLVVTGWLAFLLWRGSDAGPYACWIAVGMTLGTIGDFFNAGFLNWIPLPDPVLGGIAAFGLGHMAYITGCLVLSRQAGLTSWRAFVIALTVWQLFGLVTWYFVVLAGTEARGLVWPSLPYSALLAGTAGITSGMALQDSRFLRLALGGALFLASDLILACGMFRGHVPHQTEWVWCTYGPGQMLIVFSVLSATIVLQDRHATYRRQFHLVIKN